MDLFTDCRPISLGDSLLIARIVSYRRRSNANKDCRPLNNGLLIPLSGKVAFER